ncbi:MAG: hypothetical protein ACKPKO_19115 [Candidatus Fonsibacter sp.]
MTMRTWEPSTGFTDVQIEAEHVYFVNTVWLVATFISAKLWSLVYVDQGLPIQNGISIGMYNAASPNQFAQTATIAQNGHITTQGAITWQGDLFAPNSYNRTQVDYTASTKQATITSATSFNANNINASLSVTASNYFTSGTATLKSITSQNYKTHHILMRHKGSLQAH